MKQKPSQRAFLEIGVEEIPARFMPNALAQLSQLMKDRLNEAGVPFSGVQTWGTPRRLAILIDGLAARSNDRTDVAIGPPPKAAKDETGAWTAAATGFAKAQGVNVNALMLQNTPKGERYVALHNTKGQKVETLLKDLFPSVIKQLAFPKSMIWQDQEFSFARPIRWIVALHNSNVVRFKLAGISSDRWTLGLLALGGAKITITNPDRYKMLLQGRCILVDADQRKKNILNQIETIAKKHKWTPVISDDHLQEVVYLTEYPSSILGHFPEAYLKLPREILVTVLKKQQKFFPLESSKGQLVNSFIGVRNGPSESQEDVREGYERVVNARFADGQFFYEKDSQTPLSELVPKLAGVGFHVKLGSMLDKTARVQKLSARVFDLVKAEPAIRETVERAAYLAKADLLTQIVGEFPELQGVAGRFYGIHQETAEVATALEQHYWPLTAEGTLPTTIEAAIVAVADKMDTLAANFSVGLIPSGSADPYGLRRMAMGVVRILLHRKWNVSLDALINAAFAELGRPIETKHREALIEFFNQRLMTVFGQQGYRTDEIDAVLAQPIQSLATIQEKLKALKAIRGKPEFESLSIAIKRANNLLRQANFTKGAALDGNSVGENEQKLCVAVVEIMPKFESLMHAKNYEDGLMLLAGLKNPIDTYFKEVMVMVDDAKLREQRLAILAQVKFLFDAVADFSKLQASGAAAPVSTAA